jgi:hypothetical protein
MGRARQKAALKQIFSTEYNMQNLRTITFSWYQNSISKSSTPIANLLKWFEDTILQILEILLSTDEFI